MLAGEKILCYIKTSRSTLGPPGLLISWYWALLPGVERLGSGAEVKNMLEKFLHVCLGENMCPQFVHLFRGFQKDET
jgi:hypothetical protein